MLRSLSMAPLVFALAIPALAQQTTGAQQDVRQQVEAFMAKLVDAYNRGDIKAVLAMNDPNSLAITGRYMTSGLQEVEGEIQNELNMGGRFTAMNVDGVRPIGKDVVVADGRWDFSYTANPAGSHFQGYWLRVFAREGGEWKSVAVSYTRAISPISGAATGTTGAQPTTGTTAPAAAEKDHK
jgi:ketosteroid isomerase-like protein